tara:strand:+ start:12558 stop:13406 length:849 start_codon:yes stop_codon:yes gene_type:complete
MLRDDIHISSCDRLLHKLYTNLLPKIQKQEDSISTIIQGPLNDRSLKSIPHYLKYGEVIVSCWANDDLSRIKGINSEVKIVINNTNQLPKLKKKQSERNPPSLQFLSTLNGLMASQSQLSIKTRSDESFPELGPVIDRIKNNQRSKDSSTGVYNWFKITTSNIYFRKDKDFKFHPSDHIIAGNTKRLIDIFKQCINTHLYKNTTYKSPEQIIGESTIETYFDPINKKNDIAKKENSIELMKKHFDIIRIRDLPNRTWTSSLRSYDALRSEEDWCHDINQISS